MTEKKCRPAENVAGFVVSGCIVASVSEIGAAGAPGEVSEVIT